MLVLIVLVLLHLTLIQALPQTTSLDYLDPILYQEHIQSPNGHYKYGFESNNARAQQIHEADGTSKGFYSYLDNQGKVQHVEYIAGQNGFKVIGGNGSPILPAFTPEVEAARSAHLDAYLETRRRDLAQYREGLNSKPFQSEYVQKQNHNVETPFTINIPLNTYNSKPAQSHPSNTFDGGNINLFSGQPLSSTHQSKNYNSHHSTVNTFQTTTPPPTTDDTRTNLETKFFVLPSPTVHHYEKIWPLPPLRFKDLEVRVNGQDWYDPRPRYYDRGVASTSPTMPVQNVFGNQQTTFPSVKFPNPFANQFSQKLNHYLPQLTVQHHNIPETAENSFGTHQTSSHSSDFYNALANQLRQSSSLTNIEPGLKENHFQPSKVPGLTAHQADLINYRQRPVETTNPPNIEVRNQFVNFDATTEKNKINPVNKSHVDVKRNIATLAAKRAFEAFKEKFSLA